MVQDMNFAGPMPLWLLCSVRKKMILLQQLETSDCMHNFQLQVTHHQREVVCYSQNHEEIKKGESTIETKKFQLSHIHSIFDN